MAYTPELSLRASCTLRRIAWALNMPMTQRLRVYLKPSPGLLTGKRYAKSVWTDQNAQAVLFLSQDNTIFNEQNYLSIMKGENIP